KGRTNQTDVPFFRGATWVRSIRGMARQVAGHVRNRHVGGLGEKPRGMKLIANTHLNQIPPPPFGVIFMRDTLWEDEQEARDRRQSNESFHGFSKCEDIPGYTIECFFAGVATSSVTGC